MDLDLAHACWSALCRQHEAGEDVRDEARALCRAVAAAAPGASGTPLRSQTATAGQREALDRKAVLILEHCTIGALTLPAGADARLTEIARGTEGLMLGEALANDFNTRLGAYREAVKDIQRRIDSQTRQAAQLEAGVKVLATYRDLLDTLLGDEP